MTRKTTGRRKPPEPAHSPAELPRRPTAARTRRTGSPTQKFVLLAVACIIVSVAYVSWVALRNQARMADAAAQGPAATAYAGGGTGDGAPRLVFQHVVRDENYAKVAVLPVADLADGTREVSDLTCERVHVAAGQGICLVPEHGVLSSTHYAVLFDAEFRPRGRVEIAGPPSRARVSPDGRYAAATVFVYGHSYADAAFSTQTTILDVESATIIGELEQFTVLKDGAPFKSEDFNFWGVTFARDSNRFYATLRTSEQHYLVEGDVAARTMRILRDGVECPSLSPDDSRVVFKKRSTDRNITWRLHVLDLTTGEETPLAETDSVDDQAEWLDDGTVMYAKGADLWAVPSNGEGAPYRLLAGALSPAVVQ